MSTLLAKLMVCSANDDSDSFLCLKLSLSCLTC